MALLTHFRRDYSLERAHITDPDTGVEITQLTSFPTVNSNLYFHSRCFTPDARTVIFQSMTKADRNGIMDLYAVNVDGTELRQLSDSERIDGIALHPGGGTVYYAQGRSVYEQDIETGDIHEFARFPGGVTVGGGATMTESGKSLCMNATLPEGQGIALVSTENGGIRMVPTECYPAHLQIEPSTGETALYAGPSWSGTGHSLKIVQLHEDGEIELPLHEHNGHFAWMGTTGMVYTGSVFGVNRISACNDNGEDCRTVVEGPPYFWHPGCDPTGEWMVSDTNWPDQGLWLINTRTGKMKYLCASGSSNSHPAWSHPHPCVGPRSEVVVFNSDRTGVPHIYAAHIPEEFRAELSS